jgi:hypothetical protein
MECVCVILKIILVKYYMKKILLLILLSFTLSTSYSASKFDVFKIWNTLPHKSNTTIEIEQNDIINAYAEFLPFGYNVIINTGLLKTVDEDELAFVIAHEIGHTYVGYDEDKADIFGAKLIIASGKYDICKGRNFFKKLYDKFGKGGNDGEHSSNLYRFDVLSKMGRCKGTSVNW